MAKTIEEVFFRKNSVLSTQYPVSLAIRLKEMLSLYGKVSNFEEKVYGSVTGKKMDVSFECSHNIDNVTSAVLSVRISGEEKNLLVLITGSARTVLQEGDGIFNDIYEEASRKSVLPKARDILKKELGAVEEAMRLSG